MEPRVYVYLITFKEVQNFYIGWHKEKKFGDDYMGSPSTNKDFWRNYSPIKEIICEFDYSEKGVSQAQELEKQLIKLSWDNPLSLNRSCGGKVRPEEFSKTMKECWKDPEFRDRHSRMMRKFWRDSEFLQKMLVRDLKRSEEMLKLWEDLEYRYNMGKMAKEIWENPERRKKHEEHLKKVWSDPEFREKVSQAHKENWEDPEYREKACERMKKRWEDPNYKQRMSELGGRWMWITDGTKDGTFKVLKTSEIPAGFRRGRTLF